MHLSVVVVGAAAALTFSVPGGMFSPPGPPMFEAPASVDVTVVEETCLDPDDRRLLDDPAEKEKILKFCYNK